MKTPETTINMARLRLVVNAIFDYIEHDLQITEIPLEKDYYWRLDDEDKYNMREAPKEHLVGQLVDDWEFLQSTADDPSMATPLSFMHLAPLLDYLATQVNWYAPQPEPVKH